MNNLLIGLLILATSLYINGTASAALVSSGNGYVYDKDIDITRLDQTGRSRYGNYNYGMSWQNAIESTSELTEGCVSDWRHPSARDFDGVGPISGTNRLNKTEPLVFDETDDIPYGYLAKRGSFRELGQGRIHQRDTHDAYSWDKAWKFDNTGNKQNIKYDRWVAYGSAVHDGEIRHHRPISAVPIPTTLPLIISGFFTLWLFFKTKSEEGRQIATSQE